MNRQEFEDASRRYREEMFRMYAARQMDPPPKPQPRPAPPPPAPPRPNRPAPPPLPPRPDRPAPPPPPLRPDRPVPPPPRPPFPAPPPPPMPRAVPAMAEDDIPQDDPPLLPDAPSADDTPPAAPPEDEDTALGKRPYTGIITVHVTTGLGAMPVPGASVMMTRDLDGQETLVSIQTTDQSGLIRPVTVPAPPPSEDQRNPAFFSYGISVDAAGYYREHSTDVPVFPGITSMQNFILIPLPAGSDEPLPDGDITFYNDMQKF